MHHRSCKQHKKRALPGDNIRDERLQAQLLIGDTGGIQKGLCPHQIRCTQIQVGY